MGTPPKLPNREDARDRAGSGRTTAGRVRKTGHMTTDPFQDVRPRLGTTAALVALVLLLWLGLYLELLLVVPGFEQTFADFRLRLPVGTEAAIAASRWVNRYWYVPPLFELMTAPVIAAVSYLVRHRVRSRWPGVAWWVLAIGIPVALIGLVAVSFYLPMSALRQGLAK